MMHDLDDLVGNLDLADELGVTAAAVTNWAARHADFPKPLVRVSRSGVPLYSRVQVIAWARRTGHGSVSM